MFDLKNNDLDKDDPWSDILAATDFVVRITYHAMLQYMPGQLVLVYYKILNTLFVADWESMMKRKQKLI